MTFQSAPSGLMPPKAPLAMPAQDLSRAMRDPEAPPSSSQTPVIERLFLFSFALLASAGLAFAFLDWFQSGGLNALEIAVMLLGTFTFFWIALSVSMAILGCLPRRRAAQSGPAKPLDTALLLPIFGEDTATLQRNVSAMLEDLRRRAGPHAFTLFILSDTRDPHAAEAELRMARALRKAHPSQQIHYRRRPENTRYKAGNIEEWVTSHGAAFEAMLVLDADSVMSAAAINALADALSRAPSVGLIQSVPRLIGGETLFARMQQFANTVYGTTLARGLARWVGGEANYWGHNAIMRTRAFAACAGLPDLPGRRPFGGVVLSHDFVEAALIRRAGWKVEFLTDITESYETTPASPIAHILRDRRWCQGNLQHLRIVGSAGLNWVSRMHMIQGAMAYLASLLWFSLLVLWVAIGLQEQAEPVTYFDAANPLYVAWPVMDQVAKLLILLLVYGMLIAPKLIGALHFWARDPSLCSAGGPLSFWASWVVELVVSVLLAPLMMIQHMGAVLRSLAGIDTGWKPKSDNRLTWITFFRFHVVEILAGSAMIWFFVGGYLGPWLMPVGACLLAAPLISAALSRCYVWANHLFLTPQETAPPRVLGGAARAESPALEPSKPAIA